MLHVIKYFHISTYLHRWWQCGRRDPNSRCSLCQPPAIVSEHSTSVLVQYAYFRSADQKSVFNWDQWWVSKACKIGYICIIHIESNGELHIASDVHITYVYIKYARAMMYMSALSIIHWFSELKETRRRRRQGSHPERVTIEICHPPLIRWTSFGKNQQRQRQRRREKSSSLTSQRRERTFLRLVCTSNLSIYPYMQSQSTLLM